MDLRPLKTSLSGARRQRGTMLVISLIVLVAMTLAGVAMMRSVDTSAIVAGNIAFKQSSLNAADGGIQAGFIIPILCYLYICYFGFRFPHEAE